MGSSITWINAERLGSPSAWTRVNGTEPIESATSPTSSTCIAATDDEACAVPSHSRRMIGANETPSNMTGNISSASRRCARRIAPRISAGVRPVSVLKDGKSAAITLAGTSVSRVTSS
jgi:hypothetical protein